MAICREYGQPPSWWDTIDRGQQAELWADAQLRAMETERAIKRARNG